MQLQRKDSEKWATHSRIHQWEDSEVWSSGTDLCCFIFFTSGCQEYLTHRVLITFLTLVLFHHIYSHLQLLRFVYKAIILLWFSPKHPKNGTLFVSWSPLDSKQDFTRIFIKLAPTLLIKCSDLRINWTTERLGVALILISPSVKEISLSQHKNYRILELTFLNIPIVQTLQTHTNSHTSFTSLANYTV